MNILYITQQIPYPLDSGGKIKSFSTIALLSKQHDVYLAAFIEDEKEKKYLTPFKKRLRLKKISVVTHPLIVEKSYRQQLWMLARSLFTLRPYSVYKFWHPEMSRLVSSMEKSVRFDVVWIDHISMAQYFVPVRGRRSVLEMHNVEHILYERHRDFGHRMHWRMIFWLESLKYLWYQRRMIRQFDRVLTISQHDQQKLSEAIQSSFGRSTAQIEVFLPPVRDEFFRVRRRPQPSTIMFMGLMTWYPNRRGVEWFIHEVFPTVQHFNPEVRLTIVGQYSRRNPPTKTPGVRYVGHVQSVLPYLASTSLFIVPLQIGSGVRIKILEAMAAGVPIVSTTVGAEGIPVENGKHMLIADDAPSFARAVTRVLKDKKLRTTLAKNAKQFVRRMYGQDRHELTVRRILRSFSSSGG